jgi:hypothetical protein
MTRISISDTKNMETFRRKINRALDEVGLVSISTASIFSWREGEASEEPTGEMIDTPDWSTLFTEQEVSGGNL